MLQLHSFLLVVLSVFSAFSIRNARSDIGIACPCVNGNCSDKDGACKCEKGWTGVYCERSEEICPSGCGPGGYCDLLTKKCSCGPGFYGHDCNMECPNDYYGTNCGFKCSSHCNFKREGSHYISYVQPAMYTRCNRITGACRCDELIGLSASYDMWSFCKAKCPPGFYDVIRCRRSCLPGKFGYNCTQECPVTVGSNGHCDPVSGRSICKPGYQGHFCTKQCPPGTFGLNCNECKTCKFGQCNLITGECQCLPGWTGLSCSEVCPNGTFGQNCMRQCSCANGTCDPASGDCTCFPGFSGPDCREPCAQGRWGPNCVHECLCLNGARCDAEDGKCICMAGFTGELCEQRCPAERFGANCDEECSCKNGAECNKKNGTCFCSAGWKGDDCSEGCTEGSFGQNCAMNCSCENGASCDPASGICNCTAGFHGEYCEEPCTGTTWGPNCSHECSPECIGNGGSCSVLDGLCLCPADRAGEQCHLLCSNAGDECIFNQCKGSSCESKADSDVSITHVVSSVAVFIVCLLIATAAVAFAYKVLVINQRKQSTATEDIVTVAYNASQSHEIDCILEDSNSDTEDD